MRRGEEKMIYSFQKPYERKLLCVICVHLRIVGTVQGVFFRAEAKRKAEELGVTGWVRNCNDGSVEVHIEGNEEAVPELIDWCHEGPPMAKVEDVLVKDAQSEQSSEFVIIHNS